MLPKELQETCRQCIHRGPRLYLYRHRTRRGPRQPLCAPHPELELEGARRGGRGSGHGVDVDSVVTITSLVQIKVVLLG
jgi:hypothetical protein